MKKIIILICFFSGIFLLNVQSQDVVKYAGDGKIVKEDGTEVSGKVFYWLINPQVVRFKETEDGKEIKYKTKEVKSFELGEKKYFRIKTKDAIGTNPYTYAELLTDPGQKMAIYKYQQQPAVASPGQFTITTIYYVQIPGEDAVYPPGDIKFMPLNKKMSKIVGDCPDLAKKISKKEKGYFYGMVSTDEQRVKILTTIINEYNSCNP